MVRSIIYTLAAIALCAGLFIFTQVYVNSQFDALYVAADSLHEKVEEGNAGESDAKSVMMLWEEKKTRLHIFIPHNDIGQIDNFLSEAAGHIRDSEFGLALAKLEVVKHLAKSLPGSYSVTLENVF